MQGCCSRASKVTLGAETSTGGRSSGCRAARRGMPIRGTTSCSAEPQRFPHPGRLLEEAVVRMASTTERLVPRYKFLEHKLTGIIYVDTIQQTPEILLKPMADDDPLHRCHKDRLC